mgnify:CR=1 FL=1
MWNTKAYIYKRENDNCITLNNVHSAGNRGEDIMMEGTTSKFVFIFLRSLNVRIADAKGFEREYHY